MNMQATLIHRLEDAGFTREQVEALSAFHSDQSASKADVGEVKTELKSDLAGVRAELKTDMAEVRGDINLLRWMVGLSIALSIAIVLKLFL